MPISAMLSQFSEVNATISSLHIGQASLVEAASAAAGLLSPSLCSSETLELRSWASVEGWEEELTDTELAAGESRLEFLGGYTGERGLPLPSTLPPPSFRADMSPYIIGSRHGVGLCAGIPVLFAEAGLAESPTMDYISSTQPTDICFCSWSCGLHKL